MNQHIITIGASMGGLDAINSFFKVMPANIGASFIIVQHLHPTHKSLMKDLLLNYTLMEVEEVQDGATIRPNVVYLMPSGKVMYCENNQLRLLDRDMQGKVNMPIDMFLKSVAKEKKNKNIAIILSGAGNDGTEGVKEINKHGGLVIVQDEASAQFSSMPHAAIATGGVNLVLKPEDMPRKIMQYLKSGTRPQLDIVDITLEPSIIESGLEPFNKIIMLIKDHTGVDFINYKKNTILRRIERRMDILEINSISKYVDYIYAIPDEISTLYNEIFIGVTSFFRDEEAFEVIEKVVIPQIGEKKSVGDPIRIWSAGCSTGEEVYSLAILVREYLEKHGKLLSIKIFATDLSDTALATASTGIYSQEDLAMVSQERLDKYFDKKGSQHYQINSIIRDMIIFAKHNLISAPPFAKMDLISCRNLLIYLEPTIQQNIFANFNFSLNSNGYLFLGASESVGEMIRTFEIVDNKWKIFKYIGSTHLPRQSSFQISQFEGIHKENSSTYQTAQKKWLTNTLDKSISKIVQILQDTYIPTGVIIDEDYELVHILGDVNKYIKMPSDRVSLNLLKMIRKDLSVAVGTAIHNVFKENKTLRYNNIMVVDEDMQKEISIMVKVYNDTVYQKRYAIILFEEAKNPIDENIQEESFKFQTKAYERIGDLEHELKYTKEHLQALIEELEASNEELQSTNEELVSSNEELQNTIEELQSVNEELYTVNADYNLKISELTHANDDINNLLEMTNINAIFLDEEMRVRRFTPSVKKIINLIETDIGRSLADISTNMEYPNFIDDIRKVLDKSLPIEQLVSGLKSETYRITIRPYTNIQSKTKGVVVNILDIDAIQQLSC
ncbi:MAG: hypothetical protein ATN36_03190 [Epulopiscium sp. Nele67-Bin005]|nr:MAG: hypothetical protein ATN36_03190 [Epulopiscium sp. Nele67-Bin005]